MSSPSPSVDSLIGTNSSNPQIEQESNATPVLSDSSSTSPANSLSGSSNTPNTKCGLCNFTFTNPKVLPCLHSFCQGCLEKSKDASDKFVCPHCQQESTLTRQEIDALIPDFTVKSIIELVDDTKVHCTICIFKSTRAVAHCCDCYQYLCSNCATAHLFMHCFKDHRVVKLSSEKLKSDSPDNGSCDDSPVNKITTCLHHKMEALTYFCKSCCVPVCMECIRSDHHPGFHHVEYLNEEGPKQLELLNLSIQEYKTRAGFLTNFLKKHEDASEHLKAQYQKAMNEINNTYEFYKSMLDDRKRELQKELKGVYAAKQLSLKTFLQKSTETVDSCELYEKIAKNASMVECLLLKNLFDPKFQSLMQFNVNTVIQSLYDFEFVSNYPAIQAGVSNTFGYIRSSPDAHLEPYKQPPIARPHNGSNISNNAPLLNSLNTLLDSKFANGLPNLFHPPESTMHPSPNSLGPFTVSSNGHFSSIDTIGTKAYDKWSNGTDIFQKYSLPFNNQDGAIVDAHSEIVSPTLSPSKTQLKYPRQKMIYYCKFGEYGVLEGQFTEPSGVAVNAQNDIIVADTNNHRIQIFDKEGRFKFQFGEYGKKDGQFLFPNRVTVMKTSGDIIITERSPTHQVQVYNQYGQFVRKFGANVLQYPRGVAVDNKGRIIIVECKVMRVVIFDINGELIKKWGCSKHVEFPNGIVVNEKEEIFISDNRAHCVKVFNYEGAFLRQIGCYGVINYPIGVGISSSGEILIADNHNNFNLTIFKQDGQFISALESKIKHAQCFDVALMDEGSVVLASKDYRIYIYRYLPVPPHGLK